MILNIYFCRNAGTKRFSIDLIQIQMINSLMHVIEPLSTEDIMFSYHYYYRNIHTLNVVSNFMGQNIILFIKEPITLIL